MTKCISVGCNNELTEWELNKQKIYPRKVKYKQCSNCRNHGYKDIQCALCNRSVERNHKYCDECAIIAHAKSKEKAALKRVKPRGKCVGCGIQLTRDEHGNRTRFCTEECSGRFRHAVWWEINHPKPKCLGCGIQLNHFDHKGKKKFCSYGCWGEYYYKKRKGLLTSTTTTK